MDKGFKSLITWQKAYKLALDTYLVTRSFPREEQYSLVYQIRRAAISISANIAEGYERNHRKEYLQFLMIARSSLGELETYLMFSKDLGYLNSEKFENLELKRQEVGKLLRGLINSLAN